jgi:hypothetical protein
MSMRNILVRSVLIGLAGIAAIGTIFGAGFLVGRRSAQYDSLSASRGGHGAIGKIQKIDGASLTVRLANGATLVIVTNSQTRIEKGMTKTTRLAFSDLKASDNILVIGEPNAQGFILARMIRVSDTPPLTPTPSGL